MVKQNADILTESEIEEIIIGIYLGHIDPYHIPTTLYNKTVDYIADGVVEGFGEVATAEEQALIESLFHNVQAFSAAKAYHEIADLQSLIYKDGKIIEFLDFKREAIKELTVFNKTYLETEYLYAVENARAAKRWVTIWNDKSELPLLEYVTVGDARVREAHRILDGTVRPVGDRFWNSYYPPLCYQCRCATKSYEEGQKEITEILSVEMVNKSSVHPPKIDRQFKFNSGKKGIIFSPYHPYFTDVPDNMKEWAMHNFGLPMVKNMPGYGKKV